MIYHFQFRFRCDGNRLLQNPSPIDQTHLRSSPTKAPCDQALDWHDSPLCGSESVLLAEEAPAMCSGMWDWSQVQPKTANAPEDPDRRPCIDVDVAHLICSLAELGETSDSATLLSRKSPVKCPDWPRAIPSVAMRIWRCRSMHAQRWRIASCCETPATCGETNRSCGDTWTRVLQGCNPLCGLWNTECWFTQPLKVLLAQLELSECSGSHLAESFGWNRGDLITELCYGIGLFANLEKTTPRCAMSEVLDTWATITSLALQGQVITQVTQTHLSTYAVLGLWASDTILA